MRTKKYQLLCFLVLAVPLAAQSRANTTAQDAAIESRVDAMLAKLTPQQKLEMLGGKDGFYIHAEPSIGLPPLRMADGPVGIRNVGASTAYPAGIALAATFDTDLAYTEGVALGRDAHARGVAFLLGPGVNLYRAPMNGRNFEYFGEDPYLASRMAVQYILGVQKQGVSATVKHFALNNEEYDRHKIDSVVDERTLHELYLPAFEAAIQEAHVGALMTSYNLVNGVHASQSGFLNNEIAKRDFGFRGVMMSDWSSVYDGVAAANGGLDLEMPSAKLMTPATLNAALANGTLTQATIDDKVRRILRLAVRMGWIDQAPVAVPASALPLPEDPASRAVARKVALESITLLKNEGGLLPLVPAKLCKLAVIGPNAEKAVVGGGGSALVTPPSALSLVEALRAALPATASCPGVVYARGLPSTTEIFHLSTFDHGISEQITSPDAKLSTPRTLDHLEPTKPASGAAPVTGSGHWTADHTPQASGPVVFFVSLSRQDSAQLLVDGKTVLSIVEPEGSPFLSATVQGTAGKPLHAELTVKLHAGTAGLGFGVRPLDKLVSEEARALAATADAVLLAVGYDAHTEGEGFDRTFSLPAGQDELIREISARNPHTIVSVNAGGGFDMAPWLSSVPALLHQWYPGEEGAPALAAVLLGSSNPEGHLPVSFERSFADNPTHDSYYPGPGSTASHPVLKLDEGLSLGYRYYASSATKPQFAFGYGLSYTQFAFSHLHASRTAEGVVVTLDVKNTGPRAGGEAVQVYVSDPSATVKRPLEELKAFRKIHLEPKEQQHLEFTLDRRAFSWWNPVTHAWQLDPGKFTILAGDASDHLPLTADVDYTDIAAAAPQRASAPNALFPTNPAPQYNGTKEFSLNVTSTKFQRVDGKDFGAPPQVNRTRVMEQLAGFTPRIVPIDQWGGRMDHAQPATGFFYTKKVDGRWWAIDPAGHEYINVALVAVSPSTSPDGKAALARLYGDQSTWINKTHALMLQNGFNSAGAWSDVDHIRTSALQSSHPISYTVIFNFMANYGRKRGGLHDTPGHAGFPNDTIFVFDPEFPTFVETSAKQAAQYADDPNLFGYFSDNELPFSRKNLDGYLALQHKDPGYLAARKWSDEHKGMPADEQAKQFLAYEADLYYSIVSAAIRRNDPHHMYLGSRNTGESRNDEEMFRVLGKYADCISINYYNSWTPDTQLLAMWERASGKPSIITEWYVKGKDSGMPNTTGAGWLVASQADRGAFYQNFTLGLLASKSIVGWQWFKYQDNDPNDPKAELSNKDANKGIVNTRYQVYAPLLDRMRQLNPNVYALADYFDHDHQQ